MKKQFKSAKLIGALFVFTQFVVPAWALGPVNETALRNAWALSTQQKYAASADAFEALIRTSTPNARLYYYAAAASRNANRLARAKQLSAYVIANFPQTAEAAQAKQLFPDSAPKETGVPTGLPDSLRNKSLEELMQTEEGRKALKEALKKPATTGNSSSSAIAPSKGANKSDRLVTPDDIVKDGPGGITQFSASSDCSFESALAALTMLPRGQKLMADMIRPAGTNTYIVRFPGDSLDYRITPQIMESCKIRDKALWSTLIRCAETTKAQSDSNGSLEEALTWLTGKKAEMVHPPSTTQQALTVFIRDAVKSQNPIVCLSAGNFGTFAELVESDQAYTITDFDAATGMVTARNPHGSNSRRFRLKPEHPDHAKFEQLNDGVFRMDISLFPRYFSEVARSSI